MTDVALHGFKELENLLRKLPEETAKKVTINGLKAGGRVLVKGMKERVPVKTGKLRDSITVTSSEKVTKDRSMAAVGFKKPTSRRAHLTEFGTEHSKAEPFIRPTLDIDGSAAIEAIGKNMGAGIAREARRLAGK